MKRHAIITLVLTMGLTLLLDSAAVLPESPQDRARRADSCVVGETTVLCNPQFRNPVDNSPKLPTIRDKAKLWFLQREHLDEWKCIDEIIYRESRWIPNLWNSQGSSAYGLGQVKESHLYTHNKPMKQFIRAVKYAIHRYGTMCAALDAHNRQGWY